MNDIGYIKVHRRIWNCPIWDDDEDRFDKRSAWIDMLLLANHAEKKIVLGNTEKLIERGQFHTSTVKLSERWHWNRRTVKKYLEQLERLEMITAEYTGKGTTITIVNYGFYQSSGNESAQDSAQHSAQQSTQQSAQQSAHEQEYKNIKEKDIPKGISKKKVYPYSEIVEYLNEKAEKRYQANTKDTQKYIKARIDEGFTVDDFKTVIDKKVVAWKGDPIMDDYLRPQTLFGTKFESYLNERPAEQKRQPAKQNSFNNFQNSIPIDIAAIEQIKLAQARDG